MTAPARGPLSPRTTAQLQLTYRTPLRARPVRFGDGTALHAADAFVTVSHGAVDLTLEIYDKEETERDIRVSCERKPLR